jgi:hypothetical protein
MTSEKKAEKATEKPLSLVQIELRIQSVQHQLKQPRCEYGTLMRELADLRLLRAMKKVQANV